MTTIGEISTSVVIEKKGCTCSTGMLWQKPVQDVGIINTGTELSPIMSGVQAELKKAIKIDLDNLESLALLKSV